MACCHPRRWAGGLVGWCSVTESPTQGATTGFVGACGLRGDIFAISIHEFQPDLPPQMFHDCWGAQNTSYLYFSVLLLSFQSSRPMIQFNG